MKDLKQNIIDALSDATDFEYDKVNTSIFHEYLDDIFDQIPDNESALINRNEELEAILERVKSLEPIICFGGIIEEQHTGEAQALNNIMSKITEILKNKNGKK